MFGPTSCVVPLDMSSSETADEAANGYVVALTVWARAAAADKKSASTAIDHVRTSAPGAGVARAIRSNRENASRGIPDDAERAAVSRTPTDHAVRGRATGHGGCAHGARAGAAGG